MRQIAEFTVTGADFDGLKQAADKMIKMLFGDDVDLPHDAEFAIHPDTTASMDETLKVTWTADVTVRRSDATFQTGA